MKVGLVTPRTLGLFQLKPKQKFTIEDIVRLLLAPTNNARVIKNKL
jgi:hypothetical protein